MKIKKNLTHTPIIHPFLRVFILPKSHPLWCAPSKGQILILFKARPIATYLVDADYPDSLKLRIQQIQQIKAYSEKIGLKPTNNYTSLYYQKTKPLYGIYPHATLTNLKINLIFPFFRKFWIQRLFRPQPIPNRT